jgi:hypothetical protein
MSSGESLGMSLLIVVFLCRENTEPGVEDLSASIAETSVSDMGVFG